MSAETMIGVSVQAGRLHLRVGWLCGAVLFFEGYDIASVGYAIPSLVDVWKVHPQAFTSVLTAGNVGLLLGSLFAGLLGDRLGRKPVLIGCAVVFGFFSLLSAFAVSPFYLAALRFPTGLDVPGCRDWFYLGRSVGEPPCGSLRLARHFRNRWPVAARDCSRAVAVAA